MELRGSGIVHFTAILALLLAVAGCGTTNVSNRMRYGGALPTPARILLYDFAVSADEITPDKGFAATVRLADRSPSERDADEIKLGHTVANLVADRLLRNLRDLGLPVERVSGPPPQADRVYAVTGHFVSIQEGNRTQRVTIGFGKGGSGIRTRVKVFEMSPEGRRLVDDFEVDAAGGGKPGVLATTPIGIIAGANPVVLILANVGTTLASEKLSASVEAVAEKLADRISDVGKRFFERQGWIGGY